jgi:hypothetical protein
VTVSSAQALLDSARNLEERLQRHLIVAAAIRDGLGLDAVVVGGTAEEFWASDEYHETDLDLCAHVGPEHHKALRSLGFQRSGRHWEHGLLPVAVEFAESEIDGDYERTVLIPAGGGYARIIGREDLYVDRIRQATAESGDGQRYHSALAIATTQYEFMDWSYVAGRLREIAETNAGLGKDCRAIDSRVRRRVRKTLSS